MNNKSPKRAARFNAGWLLVGMTLGIIGGVAMKNLPVGISMGIFIGVAFGFAIPKRRR
ncbi:MAG: hypothetical protein M0Q21_08145 [Ignavibacteriaceae bacterium]|jgi:hypothetical protein|nr:hypothetical protein [Ignavibacteriaceae bacterium]